MNYNFSPSDRDLQSSVFKTIRPFGLASVQGLVIDGDTLITIDTVNGYLIRIDPHSDNTTILNPDHTADFVGVTGLALVDDTLWLTREESVYFCPQGLKSLSDPHFRPQHFVTLPYPVQGIAVQGTTVYLSCQKAGYIFVFSSRTGKEVTRLSVPGIGKENLTIQEDQLWVCDDLEQSVYCLDRATGRLIFSLLTPFESPCGLAFYSDENGKQTLFVSYTTEEAYIRDNPNADPNHELQYRDRAFIHPLYFQYYPERGYSLSNGYLIELSYVEEIAPLEEFDLKDVEWRIALPSQTDRQKVLSIDWIGVPFTQEIQEGQRVAVFKFERIKPGERHIFGWRSLIEVYGIKYHIRPRDVEKLPALSSEIAGKYLADNDDLAMNTKIIQDAAKKAIGTETNFLRKIYSIRNYVYDKLSYGIKPYIDTPDVALERGVGSCGEYLGILLALGRLNGIACRTVGRYKCPPHPDRFGVPLHPDFNHVWMEFYLPDFGWIPMESNPDDINEGGPYPTRFFMGLAWYHAEIGKGISFENIRLSGEPVDKEKISLGELAINHVRFKILKELDFTD
jgi:transglutaminase-like putative cysteine protease